MKPHEETWIVDPNDATEIARQNPYGDTNAVRAARARLAAQAPAMARLLLDLEYNSAGEDADGSQRCGFCGGTNPADGGSGHDPECRIAVTLRAAGVLE